VTALFADIVGSTSLGERLPPDEVKVLIGECVSRMTHAVEEFGGSVTSYMGDGIAAFFGLPTAHEDDPERAARAALRILAELGDYAQEVATAWGITDFNARVGINTGPTAVGLVGAADPQAVALGDTNNVAARLQGVAEPGTIAVGQATAQCLVNRFTLEPLGEVSVKGRVQPVEAWRLVSIKSAHLEESQTPLVGRSVELERLQSTVHELTSGRGQILFLLGDSGMGKTRLLTELRTISGDSVTWLEGRCYSYGTKLLYGPFIQMLRGWLGIEEGEPELSVRTKLRAKMGLLPIAELPDVLPYLARLLSIRLDPESDERLRLLPPDTLAAEIRRAYAHWLVSIAQERPVVVAIEDLHWADPPTCDLAEELLDLVDLTPLLVVATSRVDPTTEGWRLRVRALSHHVHRALELPLEPLSDADAGALLASLPQSRSLSAAELGQIVTGAEGNPLYLEELCAAFVEGSSRRGLTWAPTMAGARVLTPTLESLLLARIDRLPRGARRLAQTAAVIGRSFPLRVLERVAETDDVEGDLAPLLRADIIREVQRYPEPEYTFRHGLLREASLSALPSVRRRELYRAVGGAFERQYAESIEDHLEVLAHYFGRSDDLRKGLEYLERAGERASELDAVERAGELWERGLKLAERLEDKPAEQRLRGRLAKLAVRAGSRATSV
jgi:class 3 adenylate cyclase/predicted ATPase